MKIPGIRIERKHYFIAAAVLLMILMVKVLLLKPVIGLADNGDFFREINNAGLYYMTDNDEDRHFGYFNRIYGIRQYPFEMNTVFLSSLSMIIRGTAAFGKLFINRDLFDIRILAVLYMVFFLWAYYKNLVLLTGKLDVPVLFPALLTLVIFGDIGYLAYFNSFYGEPASYVFLFTTLAAVFNIIEKQRPTFWDLMLFTVSTVIFVGAKQQNSFSGVFLALICFRIIQLRKDKYWRLAAGLSMAVISIWAVTIYMSTSDEIKHINKYHTITKGILVGSKNPEKDLKELNLDPKFALLQGTSYYDTYNLEPPESELMQKEFYDRFGYQDVVKYYIVHTDRLAEKLGVAVKNGFSIRPEVLGNFEKAEGKAYGARTDFFSLWSKFKEKFFPKTLKYVVLLILFYYLVLLKLYIDNYKKKDNKAVMKIEVFAIVGFIGLSQLGISFMGAGEADLAKHLYLFNVCFDIMFAAAVIFVFEKFLWRRKNN